MVSLGRRARRAGRSGAGPSRRERAPPGRRRGPHGSRRGPGPARRPRGRWPTLGPMKSRAERASANSSSRLMAVITLASTRHGLRVGDPADAADASRAGRRAAIPCRGSTCGPFWREHRVDDERGLGAPPAVERGLGRLGRGGDGVHGQPVVAHVGEHLERRLAGSPARGRPRRAAWRLRRRLSLRCHAGGAPAVVGVTWMKRNSFVSSRTVATGRAFPPIDISFRCLLAGSTTATASAFPAGPSRRPSSQAAPVGGWWSATLCRRGAVVPRRCRVTSTISRFEATLAPCGQRARRRALRDRGPAGPASPRRSASPAAAGRPARSSTTAACTGWW